MKELDELRNKGFNVTIEISGEDSDYRSPYNNDPEDRPYYCNLYYGDSNGPHKPGTLSGLGWGWTLSECVENAIKDLKHPYDRK